MLVYSYFGSYVEIKRSQFNTDNDYYSEIIKIKFNITIKDEEFTVNDLIDLI